MGILDQIHGAKQDEIVMKKTTSLMKKPHRLVPIRQRPGVRCVRSKMTSNYKEACELSQNYSQVKQRFYNCLPRVLGPPCLARHTRWCPCFSVVPEVTHEARLKAIEGRRVSSKSPPRIRDGDEGVAGRNGREKYFPKSIIFFPAMKLSFAS